MCIRDSDYVLSYDGKTSKYIHNYFGWDEFNQNGNIVKYSGKAFRPAICILICTSLSGTLEMALPPSISVELVHNFSLIHDDIEDNDRVRRHKPTLWTIWGIPKAIITGNSILVLGNKVLNKMLINGSTKSDLYKSQRILTESYLKMMEGQFLDIAFEKERKISEEKYLKMISLKTGALIECSVILGAIASKTNLNEKLFKQVSSFGKNIGLLFGSFNPIHNGHVSLANFFINHRNFNQIWLIVSPLSPFKKNQIISSHDHRIAMVKLAIKNYT